MTARHRKSSASTRRGAAGAVTLLLALATGAPALVGDRDGAFGLGGSVRAIPFVLDNRNVPSLAGADDTERTLRTTLRIVAGGSPSPRFAYEGHVVESLDFGASSLGLFAGNLASGGSSPAERYRAMDLTWYEPDDDDLTGSLSIDRASVRVSFDRFDLTAGRQAVTFGKAYFWNPLDVFSPFDPREFDRDYKTGVDAARLDAEIGLFSGVTVVAAAGERRSDRSGDFWTSSNSGSALLGRAFTTVGGFDFAAQGGKVYGGRQYGGAAAGEIGPIELRVEGAWFDARGSEPLPWPLTENEFVDHATFVAGAGRYFANTLDVQVEYLDQGLADPNDRNVSLARLAAGDLFHLSRRLVGAVASYDIIPIVNGSLATIVSLDDGSFQVQPGVRWSTGNDSELVAGAIVNFGEAPRPRGLDPGLESEFGSYPQVYYAEYKYYF